MSITSAGMDVPKIYSSYGVRTEASATATPNNILPYLRHLQMGDEERVSSTIPI